MVTTTKVRLGDRVKDRPSATGEIRRSPDVRPRARGCRCSAVSAPRRLEGSGGLMFTGCILSALLEVLAPSDDDTLHARDPTGQFKVIIAENQPEYDPVPAIG